MLALNASKRTRFSLPLAFGALLVLDDQGAPLAGATVTGTLSGDLNETVAATTGSDGHAILVTTGTKRGGVLFDFCVDDVTDTSLTYSSGDHLETCDSF